MAAKCNVETTLTETALRGSLNNRGAPGGDTDTGGQINIFLGSERNMQGLRSVAHDAPHHWMGPAYGRLLPPRRCGRGQQELILSKDLA